MTMPKKFSIYGPFIHLEIINLARVIDYKDTGHFL